MSQEPQDIGDTVFRHPDELLIELDLTQLHRFEFLHVSEAEVYLLAAWQLVSRDGRTPALNAGHRHEWTELVRYCGEHDSRAMTFEYPDELTLVADACRGPAARDRSEGRGGTERERCAVESLDNPRVSLGIHPTIEQQPCHGSSTYIANGPIGRF